MHKRKVMKKELFYTCHNLNVDSQSGLLNKLTKQGPNRSNVLFDTFGIGSPPQLSKYQKNHFGHQIYKCLILFNEISILIIFIFSDL